MARPPAALRRAPGIRWDRLGRIALLGVLALVLYLYIGPTRSWISTYRESHRRHAELQALQRYHDRLEGQAKALRDPATLELQARRLGMVKGGEREFVVRGVR
jgi:cell division protein FtsB